jgi:hypothetical protein
MRDAKLEWYLAAIASTQFRPAAVPLVQDALKRIGTLGPMSVAQPLQLLALRRYLRAQNREHRNLAAIWSLSAEEMSQSINTRPTEDGASTLGYQLMSQAARVQRDFAAANPGYRLAVSPPRDLERQVALWNGNLALRATARELCGRAVEEAGKPKFELPAPLSAVEALTRWIQESRVNNEPGNAAPGTSDHGQLRAVDFVVMRAGVVIAGVRRSTIPTEWTASGWARRLADATANTILVGPLARPYEPWHWALP